MLRLLAALALFVALAHAQWCSGGLKFCPNIWKCVNISSDPNNCGSCGYRCRDPLPKCVNGHCCYALSNAWCPNVGCVNTNTNVNHCGGCGLNCAPGQVCTAGVCQVPTTTQSQSFATTLATSTTGTSTGGRRR